MKDTVNPIVSNGITITKDSFSYVIVVKRIMTHG